MTCAYPQHYLADTEGRCVSPTCPALEDCAGDLNGLGLGPPVYVYVAGPLTGDPGDYLASVAAMAQTCRALWRPSVVPVCPADDLVLGLASAEPLRVADYQERSLALLRLVARAERRCLYVTGEHHRDGRPSRGVAAEIQLAMALGVPVVRTVDEVLRIARGGRDG